MDPCALVDHHGVPKVTAFAQVTSRHVYLEGMRILGKPLALCMLGCCPLPQNMRLRRDLLG